MAAKRHRGRQKLTRKWYPETPEFGDSFSSARTYSEGSVDLGDRTTRRRELHRVYWIFPGGWAGLGLLLLRLAVATVAIVQGLGYFGGTAITNFTEGLMGSLAVACGLLLIGGIGTPFVALLLAAGLSAGMLGWLPPMPTPAMTGLSEILAVATAIAVALIGPGEFSLDARLFGRREIIIPPPPASN